MISVRRAIHSDLAVLNALIQGSSAYEGKYRAILDGYRVTEAQLDRDQVFVAETAASATGFHSLVSAAPEPELDLLFVSDAAQGMGVGTALIDHLKSFGAKQEGVVLPSGRVTWERPLLKLPVCGDQMQET